MILNASDIRPGAWVKAPSFLEDIDATDTRSIRVLEIVENNGRPAFIGLVAARDGDPRTPIEDRKTWRYFSQVTTIVRPAR